MDEVYFNGNFMPLAEARVPVLDRGLLFGDGVYEVIPAYGGHLFRLDQHLERLNQNLAAIRMAPPLSKDQWRPVLTRLLDGRTQDASVYLQITRGSDNRRSLAIPSGIQPSLFAMVMPLPEAPAELLASGVSAITLDDIRWGRCNIKATTLLANVLLKQEAVEAGAAEAILIRDGLAIEGTASNLFVVRQGRILTPPKGPLLLPGITRDLVLEIAQSAGLAYAETQIAASELGQADEIWITSSTIEIMPVTRLDGRAVGTGRPGPAWVDMNARYLACKERLRQGGSCIS
jgi:D-alanine transaminase